MQMLCVYKCIQCPREEYIDFRWMFQKQQLDLVVILKFVNFL